MVTRDARPTAELPQGARPRGGAPAEPVPLALVGLAGIGSVYAQAMQRNPNLVLCDGYDVLPANYDTVECLRGMERAPSYEAFLARTRAVGVVIATPNQFHAEQIKAAAAAGKHVLVTKPLTNTMREAWEGVEACRRAGVILGVGHTDRREGHVRKLRSMVAAMQDQVSLVEAHIGHWGGFRLSPEQWRFRRELCPGGSLILLAVHCFDTLHYLFGPIKRVSAFVKRLRIPAEIEDTSVSAVEFESGVLGVVTSSYASPKSTWLKIYGTQENLTCSDGRIVVRPLPASGGPQAGGHGGAGAGGPAGPASGDYEVDYEKRDPFYDELDDFGRAVREGREPEVTGRDGLQALACVWASLESSRTGRAVEVEDVIQEVTG